MTLLEQRDESVTPGSNEDAALAMFALMGGWSGLAEQPSGTYMNIASLLRADPEDDLSGLRLLASRMQYGPADFTDLAYGCEEEPVVDGEMTRAWLLSTNRAYVTREGHLVPREKLDHLGYAALVIAIDEQPDRLSEVYNLVTESRSPLSRDIVAGVAQKIVDNFYSQSEVKQA